MKILNVFEIKDMPDVSSLASIFFKQIQIIGILGVNKESLVNVISDRIAFYKVCFELLEKYFGATLKQDLVPILYNKQEWPLKSKLGGYSTQDTKASELVTSYLGTWILAFESSATRRIIKAVLWYIQEQQDFEKGFCYLIDLFKAGFIVDGNDFVQSGVLLSEIYAKFETCQELITEISNIEDFYCIDNFDFNGWLNYKELNNHKIQQLFQWLEELIFDEIEITQQVDDADEWLIQYQILFTLINFHRKLILVNKESYHSYSNLSKYHIDSILEEIICDIWAYILGSTARAKHLPISLDWIFINGQFWGSIFGEEIVEARVLIPKNLTKLNFKEWPKSLVNFSNLPAFIISNNNGINMALMRTKLFDKSQILQKINDLKILDKLNIPSKEIDDILTTQYFNALTQEAIAEIEGKSKSEQTAIQNNSDLVRDKKYNIEDLLYEIHLELCVEEIDQKLRPLIRQSENYENIIAQLTALSELYPWLSSIYQELGIRYDELGDSDSAISHFKSAIILEPTNANIWQSLGFMYSKNGSSKEAHFSQGILMMLRNRRIT
jgi:tetratricopeptide (TPR) repeat protein